MSDGGDKHSPEAIEARYAEASAIIREARQRGIALIASGSWRLDWQSRSGDPVPPDLLARIKQYGKQIYALVDAEQDERAAMVEDGSGAMRQWAEGFALLSTMPPPKGVSPQRWQVLIDDCGYFLDEWSARAAALGWTALDLFGCDSKKPLQRLDRQGLIWQLEGRKLLALTGDTAIIQTRMGGKQTYRRESDETQLAERRWIWKPVSEK